MDPAPSKESESGMRRALRFFGLDRRGARRPPPTMRTLWLLVPGAALGVVLVLTTSGLPHAVGGGLTGACIVVAVQAWVGRRGGNSSTSD
jgi:hypothetical protein